jgi:3-oxo-5-alpha-steroid 4-dehydrogenase 3 / polyprenol reductase
MDIGVSLLLVPIFYAASVAQSACHMRLATMKKYTLPQDELFRYMVSPHYTMESIIFLIFAMVSAPRGHILNRTMTAALFFVVANLGATARGTQAWYVEKFGVEKVPRWKMVPFVF